MSKDDAAKTTDDSRDIAEKVRSGQYFREARAMYDFTVHDPMSERYLYILITGLAIVIFFIAMNAAQSLYPLNRLMPFIANIEDPAEDQMSVRSLKEYKEEDTSEAVLRFLVQNYVRMRESYNIEYFDRNTNGVGMQSSPGVFKEFQDMVAVSNPESPIALYQRHSERKIEVVSSQRYDDNDEYGMSVIYIATVEGKNEVKKTRWAANIAFNYSGVALDENQEKILPVKFVVTKYRTKRLQDLR